jgi:hypothetical protein
MQPVKRADPPAITAYGNSRRKIQPSAAGIGARVLRKSQAMLSYTNGPKL